MFLNKSPIKRGLNRFDRVTVDFQQSIRLEAIPKMMIRHLIVIAALLIAGNSAVRKKKNTDPNITL